MVSKQVKGMDESTAEQTAPAPSPEPGRATHWTCPKCGESIPAHFTACWKCAGGVAQEAEPSPQEFSQEPHHATQPDTHRTQSLYGIAFVSFVGIATFIGVACFL